MVENMERRGVDGRQQSRARECWVDTHDCHSILSMGFVILFINSDFLGTVLTKFMIDSMIFWQLGIKSNVYIHMQEKKFSSITKELMSM